MDAGHLGAANSGWTWGTLIMAWLRTPMDDGHVSRDARGDQPDQRGRAHTVVKARPNIARPPRRAASKYSALADNGLVPGRRPQTDRDLFPRDDQRSHVVR